MKKARILIPIIVGLIIGVSLTLFFIPNAFMSNPSISGDRVLLENLNYASEQHGSKDYFTRQGSKLLKESYIDELELWTESRESYGESRLPINLKNIDWEKLNNEALLSYGQIKNLEYESIADNVLSYYDIEDEYPLTFSEALSTVQGIKRNDNFGDISNCILALQLQRKTRCTSKKKFVKIIARKTNYGGIRYDKGTGEIALSGPTRAVFKTQVNRLNVLIEALYRKRENYCSLKDYCDPWMKICLCTLEQSDFQKKVCEDCHSEIFKSLKTETLVSFLTKISATLKEYSDEEVDTKTVEAVMKAELDQLELDLSREDDSKVTPTDTTSTTNLDTISTSTIE